MYLRRMEQPPLSRGYGTNPEEVAPAPVPVPRRVSWVKAMPPAAFLFIVVCLVLGMLLGFGLGLEPRDIKEY